MELFSIQSPNALAVHQEIECQIARENPITPAFTSSTPTAPTTSSHAFEPGLPSQVQAGKVPLMRGSVSRVFSAAFPLDRGLPPKTPKKDGPTDAAD